MPARPVASPITAEATYKAREVEGFLDLYFYRKLGFCLARLFTRVHMTPSGVTLLGALIGMVAGHLYYYRSLGSNICGMLLQICANALDNADGQLARLTGRQSRHGRILDGLADYLIFISIYLHLVLRCLSGGASPSIWVLAVAAGISHALQSAAVDYARNAYLYFVKGKGELDSHATLLDEHRKLHWLAQPVEKFLHWLYLGTTQEQEFLAPSLHRLHEMVARDFPAAIPEWLQEEYQNSTQPTLKWWRLLMTNTRMLVLFTCLFANQLSWYFWFELVPLNLLLAWLLFRQQLTSRYFLALVRSRASCTRSC